MHRWHCSSNDPCFLNLWTEAATRQCFKHPPNITNRPHRIMAQKKPLKLRLCYLGTQPTAILAYILHLTLYTTPSCHFGHLELIMAVRCRSMWHSIAGECPLHTYRRCKGQKVACRLAGDCLHFLVDRFGSSHRGGRGHYFSHHRPPTSNHGLQTLTFSRPSKIKSITLWPTTGKHCVGINHLPFHA